MQGHELASQNGFNAYEKILTQADANAQKAQPRIDSLLNAIQAEGDLPTAAAIAHAFAIDCWWWSQQKSIYYGNLEVSLLRKVNKRDTTYTKALYNLGRFNYYVAEYDSAIAAFNEVVELDNIPIRTAQSYAELGSCYSDKGDIFKAITYFEKGLPMLTELGEIRSVARHTVYMAQAYHFVGDSLSLVRQWEALQTADSLSRAGYVDTQLQRYITNAIGNYYIKNGNYDFEKAYFYYQQNLRESILDNDSANVAVAANNLANLYAKAKNDSVEYYARFAQRYIIYNDTKARVNNILGQYHLNKGKLEEALQYTNKSLEVNLGKSFDPLGVPDLFDLSNAISARFALSCLNNKAEILLKLREERQDEKYLMLAIDHLLRADQFIQSIESNTLDVKTRLSWREYASEVYLKGAVTAHLLAEPASVYYFMEKNKAFLLSEEISRNGAYISLPKAISQNEERLKNQVLALEHSIAQNTSSQVLRALQDSLFNAKLNYEQYSDSIQKAHPGHFREKISLEPVSLAQTQASLSEDDVLVSYIWSDFKDGQESFLGIMVSKDEEFSFVIDDLDSLKSTIELYKVAVSTPQKTAEDKEEFVKISHHLFNTLFPTAALKEVQKFKNLYIVADNELQKIPFEALITDKESASMLFDQTNVGYLYSWSFNERNNKVARNASKSILGYAPVDFEQTGLERLSNTESELNEINELVGGDIKIGLSASKESFINESEQYKILHLATHAQANENPWIAFSDERLLLNDLYTHRINADLVTLSACQTLGGKVAKGEGVISLSRGFFYAGAQTVIASLWSVNDSATKEIMNLFYQNLKSGQSKIEALNNAKRSYLSNHSLSELSPYYWSSFVLVGDGGTVEFDDSLPSYWYMLMAMAFLAAMIILKRRLDHFKKNA